MAIGLGDINFAANDWFYPCFLSRHIKIDDAIHGAVISDGKAVHAQLFGPGNEPGMRHMPSSKLYSVWT